MKVKTVLIILGAVLACSAPFVHILIPSKSKAILNIEKQFELGKVAESEFYAQYAQLKKEQKFLGFSSPRRFWYAIGLPITLFFFATLFLFVMDAVKDPSIHFAIRFSGFILFFIAVYHLVWVVWPSRDLPKSMYHLCIFIMSISATLLAFNLILYRRKLRSKIQMLIRFISVDAYDKYVKPEDRPAYMKDSYKVYDEMLD